eukprot:403340434
MYLTELPEQSKLPLTAYRFNPAEDDVMFICDKHIQRLVFYGGQMWKDWEQEHLDQFDHYMRTHKHQLPEGYRQEEILRNLQAAQFNHKKAYNNMLRSIEWRKNEFPIRLNTMMERIIASGFLYVYGRDRNFRPIIHLRPRILANMNPSPESQEGIVACTFMMEYIRENFFLPGQIENWVVIADLDNMGLMNVPYKVNIRFCNVCTSARVFIVNVSGTFQFLWSTVQAFLESHTKKKIHITKQGTCEQLQRLVAPDQLQQKFGGSAPNFEGPLWWPPRMPETDCLADPAKIITDDEYQQFIEEHPLFVRTPEIEKQNDQQELEEELDQQQNKHIGYEESKNSMMHQNQLKIIDEKNANQDSEEEDDVEENFIITDVEISKIRHHTKFAHYPGVCRNDGEGLRDLRTNHSQEHISYQNAINDDILLTDPINYKDQNLNSHSKGKNYLDDNSVIMQDQVRIEFISNNYVEDQSAHKNETPAKNLFLNSPTSNNVNQQQHSQQKIDVNGARVSSSFKPDNDNTPTKKDPSTTTAGGVKDIKRNDRQHDKSKNKCCTIF